jgi:hypothetical protein
VTGRTWLADGLERAEEFAAPEGWAVPPRPDGVADARPGLPDAPDGVPDALAGPVLAGPVLAGPVLAGAVLAGAVLARLDRGEAERRPEAAVADGWPLRVAGPVAGLNVATDSMAPATRQTARMLASSGITVPCPANGAVSFRSRLRRRRARSSRW